MLSRSEVPTSLFGRIIGAVMRRWSSGGYGQSGTETDDVFTLDELHVLPMPVDLVTALEKLAGACGKPASAAMLTAALPLADGQMDPRFVPLAMARAELDARWSPLRLRSLTPSDFPVVALVRTGGALLITGRTGRDRLQIEDATGAREVNETILQELVGDDVLTCGHIDPENGASFEEERSLVQRNPKLWLLGLYMSERSKLQKMIVAAILLNICALAVPLYMRAIYDRVIPNLAIESLWALSIGVAIVLVFEFVLKHVRSSFIDAVGVRVGQLVQHRAMTSFLNARIKRPDNNVGMLMTALRDIEAVTLLVPLAVVTFVIDVPFFFAYLALIVVIGGWTVAGPVMGAGAMALVGIITSYALKLSSAKSTKLMQARSNLVVDVAEGIATIKANQAEGRFLRQWDIVSDHIGIGAQTSRKWTELPGSMSGFVVQFVTVMVVIIGVFQIKAGVMTSGAMIAVTMLTGRAMVPVSNAIGVVSKAYQSMAQLAGLAQILTMEAERDISDPAIARRPIVGRICLNDVTCRYHEAAETSLTNVSLSIERGEKIAIIGRSGSGKSTLLRAISGMLPVESGAITVDGHMMSQFAAAHLRKSIVYAGQDAGLFNSSIWENILLGMEEPEEQVVERAITVSCLDRFVSRSVEGFTRNIGPGGCKLSGGQRQSLVLARALIRDPGTLLLDEPTASMDINAEQGVINGLRTSMNGRTLIIATHRMALLEVVDRIILVEGGKIVADRPQREMLAKLRDQYQASPARAAA